MKENMRLISSILIVLILCNGIVFAATDEDPSTSKKAKKTTSITAKVADSDNDNVPDDEDECPNIPGSAATRGCPDNDGDGIPDHLDGCPSVPGIIQFKGCPDTDLDGIPDNADVCPYEAGPVSNNGCPLPKQGEENRTVKGTKVIDTINLDEERDLQIMRYERYVAEQELKQQEYLERIAKSNNANNAATTGGDKKTISHENKTVEEAMKEGIATIETSSANSAATFSTVTINNAMYLSYKPKLEILLKNMRFQDGRVRCIDENKFFEALSELASYCNTYPEWILTFHCYSNETDNAYGNKQLFSNRVHVLKQILVDDLHISSQRLNFVNSISHTSETSNFISLKITVK
jgi:hypothetical protein